MTRDEWYDLSDSELRAKLTNRGVPSAVAGAMAKDRDDPPVARAIEEVINGGWA